MRAIRLMSIPVFFVSLALPAQTASTASSPVANSQPVCAGSYNVIRVDAIKPGMLPTFMQAVAGHQAWYAAAGAPDKIIAMRIVEVDPATKARHLSETTVLTSHIEPAKRDRPLPAEGDSYKAFIDLYKQSSTITTEYHACMAAM